VSVADDLQEREQQAGNAETNNIGQADYDEKFNKIAKATEDEDFDNIIANNYGDDVTDEKVDTHGDKIRRNYNADVPDGNRDSVKDQEENPESLYNGLPEGKIGIRGAGGKPRRFGPVGGIIGLILFAVFGVSSVTTILGSSLLINIKEALHSDRADGTRANQVFSQAAFAKKVNYNAAGCGVVAIKCRMGTMNDSQIKNYERAGFKVEGQIIGSDGKPTGKDYTTPEPDKTGTANTADTSGNRYIVKRITFPDGKAVTSGDSFFKYTQANVKMRAVSIKAFNPRSAFFLNNRFTDILGKTFGFSKGNILEGKTKQEIDKSFNDKTGGGTSEDLNSNTKPTKTEEAAKKGSVKIKEGLSNGAGIGAGAACQAYNLARYGVAAVKIARMYELVSFALPWLQAADQIKDGGRISPEVVDNLSSRLTSYDPNKTLTQDETYLGDSYKAGTPNPKYNLAATDSQGYEIAAYGDRSALKDFAKIWLLGGNKHSTVASVQSVLTKINTLNGVVSKDTGEKSVRYICKVLNSPTGQTLGILAVIANCASTLLGNEVTGPQGCLAAGAWLGLGLIVTGLLATVGEDMIDTAIKESAKLGLGSDLSGVDAGDAMAAGAGLMLGATSTASGLRPSTSVEESQEYIAYTENINNQYIAAEQYNARDTPFDAYNQYSFLGSVASKLQPVTSSSSTPFFTSLANIPSIISSALWTGSDTANALYSQPSFSQKERYDCDDTDLTNLGMLGDKFCNIATLMPPADLDAALAQVNGTQNTIDDVIDYMTHDQDAPEKKGGTLDDSFGGDGDTSGATAILDLTKTGQEPKSKGRSVDNDGKPIAGTQYALYLKYCTDARVTSESQTTWDGEQGAETYWGTSKQEIEKDSNRDQDWYSGKQCTDPIKSKMMSMFRQYTNYCLQTATMDGTNNCWNNDGATQSLGNVTSSQCASNGDTKAIYTCALKYDNYRYVMGGGHGNVPNAQAWIADFKAGKIPEWTPILDCSGLVRMAFVEAMGIEDQAYTAPGGYNSSKYWQKIPLEQAQQGDIVTSSGHVAIVESNDTASKKFKIFDAETSGGAKENNIRHSTQSYGGTIAAYRAKKG
jgi:cell wall-associated NlpC family hydrolase